jgi:hypothetical protein
MEGHETLMSNIEGHGTPLRDIKVHETTRGPRQGAHYELTNIFSFFETYNVNYKGEVRTLYLSFR